MVYFFFFKQKTAYEMRISDWSSDVCSSDLGGLAAVLRRNVFGTLPEGQGDLAGLTAYVLAQAAALDAQPGSLLREGRPAFTEAPADGENPRESAPLEAAAGGRQKHCTGSAQPP